MMSENDLVFVPIENLRLKDLYDWAVPLARGKITKVSLSPVSSPRKNGIQVVQDGHKTGCRTRSNEQDIALFRHGDSVFAIRADCPHAGGPLELGDLEEFGADGSLCVKCPWHGWKIDLSSGHILEPQGHGQQSTTIYPVQVSEEGKLYIGFKGLDPKYFSLQGLEF